MGSRDCGGAATGCDRQKASLEGRSGRSPGLGKDIVQLDSKSPDFLEPR